jgi:hypothetical protein
MEESLWILKNNYYDNIKTDLKRRIEIQDKDKWLAPVITIYVLKIEVTNSSEKSVHFYQTIRLHNSEDFIV